MKPLSAIPESPPAGFRYTQAFLLGRPKHTAPDAFSLRHPPMPPGQRAKIFAPFDALRGFDDAVAAKEIVYEPFREPDAERIDALNRKIAILRPLVENGKQARAHPVRIEVTWFCPCADPDSEAYEIRGQYRTQTGLLRKIDPVGWYLQLDACRIDLDDIYDIRDPEGRLFGALGDGWTEDPEA